MGYSSIGSNAYAEVTTAGPSAAVTLTGVTAGHLLVVGAICMSGDTCSGVASTSPALSFTKLAGLTTYGSGEISLWAGLAPSSGDYTVTASWSGPSTLGSVHIAEYSGNPATLTGIVDATNTIAWSVTGAAGSRLYLPNPSSRYAGQLAVTLLGWPDGGGSSATTLAASAPWTVRTLKPDAGTYGAGALLDAIPADAANLDVVANASVGISSPAVLSLLLNDAAPPTVGPRVVQHKAAASANAAAVATGTLASAPVQNNLLVAVVESRGAYTASLAGWNVERSGTNSTTNGLTVLTKTAGPSEGTTGYSFTMSGTSYHAVSLFEIGNHNGVDSSVAPGWTTSTSTINTAATTPAATITPTVDNCLVIVGIAKANNEGLAIGGTAIPALSNGANSPPAPWSEYGDIAQTGTAASRGRLVTVARPQGTAAAASLTLTFSPASPTSTATGAVAIAITPAVSLTTSTRTGSVTAALATPGRMRTAAVTAALSSASVESTRTAIVTAALGTSASRTAATSAALGTGATRTASVTAPLGTTATRTASVSAALATPDRSRTATVTAALAVAGASSRTATVTAALATPDHTRSATVTAALGLLSQTRTGSVSVALGLSGLARTASVTAGLGMTATRSATATGALGLVGRTRTAAVTAALATAASGIGGALPLISRGYSNAYGGTGTPVDAFSSNYDADWYGSGTGWVAVNLNNVPAANRQHVLLQWYDEQSTDYYGMTFYAHPTNYTIGAHASTSTTAPLVGDAGWVTLATVTACDTSHRQHLLDLSGGGTDGYRWVRMRLTAATGSPELKIDLHDVHASLEAGGTRVQDDWIILGDSITAGGATASITGGSGNWRDGPIGNKVALLDPSHHPPVMDGGNSGQDVDYLVTNRVAMLAACVGRYVGIEIGGAVTSTDAPSLAAWKASLNTLIDYVESLGRIPVLATISPHNASDNDGVIARNVQIAAVYSERPEVRRGPDMYRFFIDHMDLYMDDRHPAFSAPTWSDGTYTYSGAEWWQHLWAEAIVAVYVADGTTATSTSTRTALVTAALATPGRTRTAVVTAALDTPGTSSRTATTSAALSTPDQHRTASVSAALSTATTSRAVCLGWDVAWAPDPAIPWADVTQVTLFGLQTTNGTALDLAGLGVNAVDVAAWVTAAHAHDVLAWISIGGISDQNVHLAGNATNRAGFVTNLVSYAQTNGFDGVEIDFEDETWNGLAAPVADMVATVQAIATAAHATTTTAGKSMLVSADITTPWQGSYYAPCVGAIDQWNLMTYGDTAASSCAAFAADVQTTIDQGVTDYEHFTVGIDLEDYPSATPPTDCTTIASWAAARGLAGVAVWNIVSDTTGHPVFAAIAAADTGATTASRTAAVTAALATPGRTRSASVRAALGLVSQSRTAGVSGALGLGGTRTATVTAALSTPGLTRTAVVTAALDVAGAASRTALVTAALATPGRTRQAGVSAALSMSAARTAGVAAAVGVSGLRTAATTAAVGLVGRTRTATVTAALAVAGSGLRTATVTAALATPGVTRMANVTAALGLVGRTRTAAVSAAVGLMGTPGRLVLLDRPGVTLLLERVDAMTTYDVGDVAELQVTLSALGIDGTYAAADADVLVLLVQGPAGPVASRTLAGGEVLRRATGVYYTRLPLDADGVWRFVWQATGAVVGSEPGSLRVRVPAVVAP